MSKDTAEQTDPTEEELGEVVETQVPKICMEDVQTLVKLEYVPQVLKFLKKDKIDEWMHIGEELSKESHVFGIAYYKNVISALEKKQLDIS